MTISSRLKVALDWASMILPAVASCVLMWGVYAREAPKPRTSAAIVEDVSALNWTIDRPVARQGVAKVVLIEFSDFQCPFCAAFAKGVLPSLKREFVDKGRAGYVFMQFPLDRIHPEATSAAILATCATEQERFWRAHDRLFADASSMREAPRDFAKSIDADVQAFEDCAEEARDAVAADVADGRRFEVQGTPTILSGVVQADGSISVRRRLTGRATLESVSRMLEETIADQ